MNMNGDSATMYGTIPAVAGLNRVEGFDPSSLLGRTVCPATGEEGLQLGLAYKKLWFRLAYPEGRLQTEKVSLTEQMAVFEARVYLHYGDADPVSSFVSGCAREDAPGGRYIQAAQDQAMDAALTDAGFGLQFADLCTDSSMAGDGGKPVHPRAGDAATEKSPARNAGSIGTVVPAGNTVHTGNVVRPFPGAAADGGTKKAPMPGTQPVGARQPGQEAAMPQGQAAPAGIGQPIRPAATMQNQGRQPAGTGQSVQAVAMPQNQGRRPAGTGQSVQAAAMPQNQGRQPAGTGQTVQTAAMPQNQGRQLAGARQPAQTVIPKNQGAPPAGNKLPVSPAIPQKQEPQPDGTGLPVQAVVPKNQGAPPAGKKQPVTPAMPQGQGMQPDRDGDQAQMAAAAALTSATSGKASPGGSRPGGTVKDSTASGGQAAAQNPIMTEKGKDGPSTGAVGDARPSKGQRYFGNMKAATAAQQGQPGQLPVPPASPENRGTVQAAADAASSSADSLPVPPMGKGGQTSTGTAAAADALPVPGGSPGKDKSRSDVLEAIALQNGQALPAGTSEATAGERKGSIAGTATGNKAAASMGAASPEGDLPVDGETAQAGPAPRYTPDMPVEEIVSLMTLEEAGKVVVDTGVSKGQTIAEVAERRPPSLKFYRYGGYKGPNNILRAAAQVMLESIEGQKAS